jgi:hypothetical protein
MLNAQYGEETLPHASFWMQPTVVWDVNIRWVEELILEGEKKKKKKKKKRIIVYHIASNSGISVGSIETIIDEHSLFKKCSKSMCPVGPKHDNVRLEDAMARGFWNSEGATH